MWETKVFHECMTSEFDFEREDVCMYKGTIPESDPFLRH